MEGVEDEAKKKKKMRSKKRARLKSFLHFSKALKKLHGHGRPSANDNVNPPSLRRSRRWLVALRVHAPRTNSFLRRLPTPRRCRRITAALRARGRRRGGYGCQGSGLRRGGGVAVVTLPSRRTRTSGGPCGRWRTRTRGWRPPAPTRAAPAVDWDFMEELLFCYLQLNDRAVHKDILRRSLTPSPRPEASQGTGGEAEEQADTAAAEGRQRIRRRGRRRRRRGDGLELVKS
ncbi:hypothetical protein ZWY2020_039258 [Hordeum vulgare]|nr:hypothetical protein ZWY2020_039258 [Hordeum vulgare]